ncbi:hypothetical protein L484_025792 [Morus notabilis]|uniref:Uncharacterized protein n=1 Tax=Morus notabilis TaxID=981085 RepID=W9RC64_9ROSA|nr:hypothetical protein L484_025792 [Morus notabilis]
MEGVGMSSTTKLLAIACLILSLFLATPTYSSSTTPTPAMPPSNSKVYRCGEGCARKCMGFAEKSDDQFTSCTIGKKLSHKVTSQFELKTRINEQNRRTVVLYNVASMNELEAHMARCYNGCNKDFQLSQSDEKVPQMYWKPMENVRP